MVPERTNRRRRQRLGAIIQEQGLHLSIPALPGNNGQNRLLSGSIEIVTGPSCAFYLAKYQSMTYLRRHPLPIFLLLAAALFLFEYWVAVSPRLPAGADLINIAIAADLLFGVPLLGYLLLVRTKRAPLPVLALLFLATLALANFILPPSRQTYLNRVEYLAPLVELTLLILLALKFRHIRHYYRQERPNHIFASDAAEASLGRALGIPTVAALLVTELTLLANFFTGWFRRFQPGPGQLAFSYHRRSAYGLMVAAMGLLLVVETFLVHLIVRHWSNTAAWVLTLASLYTLLWVIGDYQAIRLRPIVLDPNRLHLRSGQRWRLSVPYSLVTEVRSPAKADSKREDYVNFAVGGEPGLVLELAEPVQAIGLLGRRKQVRSVGLTLDDPKAFQAALAERRGN